MKTKMFYLLFGFLVSVSIMSCGDTNNNDSGGNKNNNSGGGGDKGCFSSEVKKLNGKCSYLETKASPNDSSDNRTLSIYYSIIPSIDTNSKKEPIALLVGGPGPSNTFEFDTLISNFPSFLRERDIIIMDYRGTGFSKPFPRCDNLFGENGLNVELFEICAGEFKNRNSKLGDYTTVNIAYDLNKILEKENIKKVVLYGQSYGTRVASTIARDYPNKVSSMILDGFFPIEANGISQAKESILDKLNDLADRYDKEYPTAKLRDRLETITSKLGSDSHTSFIKYLKDNIANVAYITDGVAQAKKSLDSLDKQLSSGASRSINSEFGYRSESYIMALGVIMHEEAYFISKQPSFNFGFGENTAKSLQSFQGGAPLDISSVDKIKSHFTKVPDDKEMKALTTDIPTIIFTGGLDYQTTKYWALNAQKTLKNSMHFFFPSEGHVLTFENKKSHTLMSNFLNNDGFLNSNGNVIGDGYIQIRP